MAHGEDHQGGADLVLTINRKLDALAVEFGAERTEVIDAGIDLSEFDPPP